MSLLICSASLDKIDSKLVKESYISLVSVCSNVLIFVTIGISILFLVAWRMSYLVVFRISVVLQGFILSCPVLFVLVI
jgi:hypothetical protein